VSTQECYAFLTLSETLSKELRFTKMYSKYSIALEVYNFDTLKCVKSCSHLLRIYTRVILLHILFVLFTQLNMHFLNIYTLNYTFKMCIGSR